MADRQEDVLAQRTKITAISYARQWGESSVPPTLLAALVASQHLHPPRVLPLMFPPALLFSSYLNIAGYKVDAAGTSAAWSGLYFLLARRRTQPLMQKWGPRGIVRGATMGLCLANFLAGGLAYGLGKRNEDPTSDASSPT